MMKQILNEWNKYLNEETLAQSSIYPKGIPIIKREDLVDPRNQFATQVLNYLDKRWKETGHQDQFKYVAKYSKGWIMGGYGNPADVDYGLSGYLNSLVGLDV